MYNEDINQSEVALRRKRRAMDIVPTFLEGAIVFNIVEPCKIEKDSCEIMVRCLFSSNSYDDYLVNRANLIDKVLAVIVTNRAQTLWIKSSLKS